MPSFARLLNLRRLIQGLKGRCMAQFAARNPNWRGLERFPPGHFHSPLLDVSSIKQGLKIADGPEDWEHISLNDAGQREFYRRHLSRPETIHFPQVPETGWRYYADNGWFPEADAFLLASVLFESRPKRIIEVGSGYSTAALLDTLDRLHFDPQISLIEPAPERLKSLLRECDHQRFHLSRCPIQDISVQTFQALESGDILFIDSSHVVKVGSDVSYLLLRVLPKLAVGTWVHFHDVFFPESYPVEWLTEGRAWNESHAIRAFLIGNAAFEIQAFHAYARDQFEDNFWSPHEALRRSTGSSLWLRRVFASCLQPAALS